MTRKRSRAWHGSYGHALSGRCSVGQHECKCWCNGYFHGRKRRIDVLRSRAQSERDLRNAFLVAFGARPRGANRKAA